MVQRGRPAKLGAAKVQGEREGGGANDLDEVLGGRVECGGQRGLDVVLLLGEHRLLVDSLPVDVDRLAVQRRGINVHRLSIQIRVVEASPFVAKPADLAPELLASLAPCFRDPVMQLVVPIGWEGGEGELPAGELGNRGGVDVVGEVER